MEKIGRFLVIQANELLEIAAELFGEFHKPFKGDHADWLTLLMRVQKETGKNYRFNPNDWGLDEVEYDPPPTKPKPKTIAQLQVQEGIEVCRETGRILNPEKMGIPKEILERNDPPPKP